MSDKIPYTWKKYTKIGQKVWYFNGKKIKFGTIYKKETDYSFTIKDKWDGLQTGIKHYNIKPFTDKGKIELLEGVWHTELWMLNDDVKNLANRIDDIKTICD